MLLLWDRGFFSYDCWKAGDARGGEDPGAGDRSIDPASRSATWPTARTWPRSIASPYDRQKDRDGIVVRVIRYTLDDPQRVGHGEVHVLITNLLDEDLYPAKELIILYHERWEEELVFDEQKTHQDPRRATKPAQLRSETPGGGDPGDLRAVAGPFRDPVADVRGGRDGRAWTRIGCRSLGCFQILKCRLPECDSTTPGTFEEWYRGLLWEMQRERTDDEVRRNRINPRVIKRKMSKWKKKRPEHRRLPPLKKTFAETVVMLR